MLRRSAYRKRPCNLDIIITTRVGCVDLASTSLDDDDDDYDDDDGQSSFLLSLYLSICTLVLVLC
jgi:hypothetical protein